MALVCLDTQILVWAIKKYANSGQEGNIARAENLIDLLTQQKDYIFVPSIVYAELCAAVPNEAFQQFSREMQNRFPIIPFDVNAAYHYRVLVQANARLREQYKQENYARPSQFADMKIVATALSLKAGVIYSEDPHIAKVAQGFIEVRRMPQVPPKQLSLIANTDMLQ